MYHWQGWQYACMDLPMADETGLLRERFATHVADIDAFAGMQKQVLAETAVSGESSAADRTIIRFVARVDSHVLPQIVVLEEGLAAFLAHGLLLPLVLRQHVLIQVLLSDETSVALRALIFRFIVRVLLMRIQTVAIAASLATDVAYHRRFPMIQSGMRSEIALDLELLTTVLAGVIVVLRVFAYEVRSQGFFTGAH